MVKWVQFIGRLITKEKIDTESAKIMDIYDGNCGKNYFSMGFEEREIEVS